MSKPKVLPLVWCGDSERRCLRCHPETFGGCGNLVVKVTVSRSACHEFEPSAEFFHNEWGRGCQLVKVPDRGWLVTSSSPISPKIRRVGEGWTLNLSRVQTSSRWCAVEVRASSLDRGSK
ncbi:hypothetical protein TNCV_2034601 [Trichonephila clavipes]|nr:hypothetical protein TNCV_2034601 [Trichonephila clavipes]